MVKEMTCVKNINKITACSIFLFLWRGGGAGGEFFFNHSKRVKEICFYLGKNIKKFGLLILNVWFFFINPGG